MRLVQSRDNRIGGRVKEIRIAMGHRHRLCRAYYRLVGIVSRKRHVHGPTVVERLKDQAFSFHATFCGVMTACAQTTGSVMR